MQTAVKVRQKLEDLAIKEHITVQYFEDRQNEQYTLPDGVVARIHRSLTRQTAPVEA